MSELSIREDRPPQDSKDLQKLIQSSKLALLGQLAAGIAHELRNPLAVLRIECDEIDRLAKELPPELRAPYSEHCDTLRRNIGKMASIIDRIHSMSASPSSGFRRLNIHEVIAEVERWSGHLHKPLGIEVTFTGAASNPHFFGNETQIEEVFLNLIRNAADAIRSSGKGSSIRIQTSSHGDRILIDVEDDGPGIAAEALPHIFDPFFTTKPEGQGVGLGLSIAAEMIKGHGGTIETDSRPGGGSKFRISLPHDRRQTTREA